SITLMISRTFSTGTPYSSSPSAKGRNFPPSITRVLPCLRRRVRRGLRHQRQQAAGVEDQSDPAVAEDGAAGDAAHGSEHLAEPLDDDLLLAEQFVDRQREAASVVVADDDRAVRDRAPRALHAEDVGEPQQR